MKKNRIAILLVIILGSVTFWLVIRNRDSGTLKKQLSDFAVKDTTSISKIVLANKENGIIELQRIKSGAWKVNGKYMARTESINLLLDCVRNVEVRNPVPKAALNNILKQMASTGTKVEIFQNDKPVKVYFVGIETQDQAGTFMLLQDIATKQNSSVPFVTHIPGFQGYLSIRYFTDLEEWKNRGIFKYGPEDLKAVTIVSTQQPQASYTISIFDGPKFSLRKVDGTEVNDIDTMRVMQYLTYFSNIQYESVVKGMPDARKDSILESGHKFLIKVSQSDGKEKQVKIYSRPPKSGVLDMHGKPLSEDIDRKLAIIDDEKNFVVIQNFVFGKLLVGTDYFRKQKIVKK